jgi:hypothetical protein
MRSNLNDEESSSVRSAILLLKDTGSPNWDENYLNALGVFYNIEHFVPRSSDKKKDAKLYDKWKKEKDAYLASIIPTCAPLLETVSTSSPPVSRVIPTRTAPTVSASSDTVRVSNDPVTCMHTIGGLEILMRATGSDRYLAEHDDLVRVVSANDISGMTQYHSSAFSIVQAELPSCWQIGAERVNTELGFMLAFPPEGVPKNQIREMQKRVSGYIKDDNMDGFLTYYTSTVRPVIANGLETSTVQALSQFSNNETGANLMMVLGAQPYAVTTLATGEYWNVLASATRMAAQNK